MKHIGIKRYKKHRLGEIMDEKIYFTFRVGIYFGLGL